MAKLSFVEESVVRKQIVKIKNTKDIIDLKLKLGQMAIDIADMFNNFTQCYIICSGREMIVGKNNPTYFNKEYIESERLRIYDLIKEKYGKSYEDFKNDIFNMSSLFKTVKGGTGNLYPRFCDIEIKPQKKESKEENVISLKRLTKSGLFNVYPFKINLDNRIESQHVVKTALKCFISQLSSWMKQDEKWNSNKQSLLETITGLYSDNHIIDENEHEIIDNRNLKELSENCEYIQNFMSELCDSLKKSYPNFDPLYFHHTYKKIFNRKNLLALKNNNKTSYSDEVNAVLKKYSKMWDGDKCFNIINRDYINAKIELYKKYQFKYNENVIDKVSCYFPDLSDLNVALKKAVLCFGNNYTPFDLSVYNDSLILSFKFGKQSNKYTIEGMVSNYFRDISLSLCKTKNGEDNDGAYQISFNVYPNKNRYLDKKPSRSISGFLKEPELRIEGNSLSKEKLLSGNFNLCLDVSISNVEPLVNHGFNIGVLNNFLIKMLSAPAVYNNGTQNISDEASEIIEEHFYKKPINVMGVDLGISPLAACCVSSYTYGIGEEFFPNMKCKIEKIKEEKIGEKTIDNIQYITKCNQYIRVPYVNFYNGIKNLKRYCEVYRSLFSQVKKIINNNMDENNPIETKKFKNENTLEQVLKNVINISGDNLNEVYKNIYSSNENFISHVLNMPKQYYKWTNSKYNHPCYPIYKMLNDQLKEILHRYIKEVYTKDFVLYIQTMDMAISCIKQHRTFGFSSKSVETTDLPVVPKDVQPYVNKIKQYTLNMKDLFLRTLASQIVNIARSNKVSVIVLEDLTKEKKYFNDLENFKLIEIWSPGFIKNAIKNAAWNYGIAVVDVDPYCTSQYGSETGTIGYRHELDKKKISFIRDGNIETVDADLNAAKNISDAFMSRYYKSKGIKIYGNFSKDEKHFKVNCSSRYKYNKKRRMSFISNYFKSNNVVMIKNDQSYNRFTGKTKIDFEKDGELVLSGSDWVTKDAVETIKEDIKSKVNGEK